MRPLEAAWVARTREGAKIIAAYRAELAKVQGRRNVSVGA